MKKTLYSALFALFCTGMTACAPVISQQPVTTHKPVQPTLGTPASVPTSQQGASLLPTITEAEVNARLAQYGKKLERWKELDAATTNQGVSQAQSAEMVSCFRELQQVIGDYNGLRSAFLHGESISSDVVSQVQKRDIAFMDSNCGEMLVPPKNTSSFNGVNTNGFEGIENLILEYSKREDYENVVTTWQKVPRDQQKRLSLESQILYAEALTYLRQEPASIAAYKNILASMGQKADSLDAMSLHRSIADLYTATEDYSLAERHYNAITNNYGKATDLNDWAKLQISILERSGSDARELRAYAELLGDFLAYIPAKDGYNVTTKADQFLADYPYTPVASNVEMIKAESERQANTWFNGLEARVAEFKNNNQYEEAITYLQAIPVSLFPVDKAVIINKQIEELLLADAIERETVRMVETQDLQKQWNNGMLLTESERYDDAIEAFKELEGTAYEPRAKAKISEISLTAAQNERRRAADFYIRYTQAGDFESQRKLLIESRKVLVDIKKKYPNAEIIPKVNSNINRVEQEMNNLDPSLLPALRAQESALGNTVGQGDILDPFDSL